MNPRDGAGPEQAPSSDAQLALNPSEHPSPADTITVELPHSTDAAEVARSFLILHAQALSPDVLADAQLLVSEIVTNAVLHGRPDISMFVKIAPPSIGIAVTDTGPQLAQHTTLPAPSATSGRGLFIVDAVAHAWGINSHGPPPGKSIWFELRGNRD